MPEFAVAYFGVLRAGLVAVPVNPGYTARELRHVLADSGAAVLIGTPAVLERSPLGAELPALATCVAPGDRACRCRGAGDSAPVGRRDRRRGPGGPPLHLGHRRAPKGAMLTHRALIANHAPAAAVDPPSSGPDDVVLLALPLFHVYGLNSGLGAVA